MIRCPAQYPGRRRGDRYIDCHLPAGHPGEHEEADTEITWTSEPAAPQVTDDLRALAAEAMRGNTVQTFQDAADAVLAAVLPKVAEQLTRRADAVPWSEPTLRRGIQYAAAVVRNLAETHPATGPESTQPDESASVVAEEAPDAPGPPEGATTHPRESARAWLAGQICAIEAGAQALEPPCGSCRWRADAILNGPGVKVEIDRIKRMPQEMGDDEPIEIRNPPAGMRPTHTQVVIRLPAQPIEDGHDG